MPLPQIQSFQPPDMANSAARLMKLQMGMQQLQAGRETSANSAIVELTKQGIAQKKQVREGGIKANDFALNLLSGVNSEEDLAIAKSIYSTRYPDKAEEVSRLLPDYNPQTVEMIRESLRTETQRLKLEEDEGIKGYGAGTALYEGKKKVGQVPFAPTKPAYEVFEGKGGDQVYVEKGGEIPAGYSKVVGKGTDININTGDLGKATKTKLEKSIVEATTNIQSFQKTKGLFKPEYLTLFGKGKVMSASAADKLGLSSKDQKTLIKSRAKWFRQAKADFIAFRKWATGVAGGEKELKEIATAFPDPVHNSPTEYIANLESIEETTKRVLALNSDFLAQGIDLDQPLSAISKPKAAIVIKYDSSGNRLEK